METLCIYFIYYFTYYISMIYLFKKMTLIAGFVVLGHINEWILTYKTVIYW